MLSWKMVPLETSGCLIISDIEYSTNETFEMLNMQSLNK